MVYALDYSPRILHLIGKYAWRIMRRNAIALIGGVIIYPFLEKSELI